MNMLCVYVFAILRSQFLSPFTWLDCVFFPWVEGTETAPL